MDPLSLSIAIGAILIALTTHIKFSECWGFKMTTRSPPQSPRQSETNPLLLKTNSPAILNLNSD